MTITSTPGDRDIELRSWLDTIQDKEEKLKAQPLVERVIRLRYRVNMLQIACSEQGLM